MATSRTRTSTRKSNSTSEVDVNVNINVVSDLGSELEQKLGFDSVRVGVIFGIDKFAQARFNQAYHCNTPSTQKIYYYRALKSQDIKEGDMVVVNTPASGFTVASVVSVDEGFHSQCIWLVDKVNLDVVEKVKERIQRAREIRLTLKRKLEEARRAQEIESLLSKDPEAMEMLRELQDMSSGKDL